MELWNLQKFKKGKKRKKKQITQQLQFKKQHSDAKKKK